MEFLFGQSPVLLAFLATMFTYTMTALGAALVFFFKDVNRRVLDCMLGFGAGVMIAASFWSLLSPAIEMCEELGQNEWLVPALGFMFGGAFIVVGDRLLSKVSFNDLAHFEHHNHKSLRRSILLVTAVTLHNIPEGLAVGVAFASASLATFGSDITGAVMLAVGIGLQNFPEGAGVSLPLRRENFSRKKCFMFGQFSGMVEPIAGVLGALLVFFMQTYLPFLLSFSAGAMIAVVASELIPEASKLSKNIATVGVVGGFIVMMMLDVALG